MLIRVLLVIFVHIIGNYVKAQTQLYGTLKERYTGKPLKYVLVINRTANKFTVSDSLGKFKINASLRDTLLFDLLGYRDTIVVANNLLKDSIIYLQCDPVLLPEALIMSRYDFSGERAEIGYFDYKQESYSLITFQEKYVRLAIFIKNPEKYPLLIKGIKMKLKKGEPCDMLIKILLMSVDSSCFCPGSVLWHKYYSFKDFSDILYEPVWDSLLVPLSGLFIVFETVKNNNCRGNRNIFLPTNRNSKKPLFLISINGGEWKYFRNTFRRKNKYPVPLVGLEVVYPKF